MIPLGLFIGIAVVGNLCSFVQAFDQRECVFNLRYGTIHTSTLLLAS